MEKNGSEENERERECEKTKSFELEKKRFL